MEDTSGFYKLDGELLLHGPNFVLGSYQSYTLRKETKNEYTYPVDGWYWFESETIAREFFELPPIEVENDPQLYNQ